MDIVKRNLLGHSLLLKATAVAAAHQVSVDEMMNKNSPAGQAAHGEFLLANPEAKSVIWPAPAAPERRRPNYEQDERARVANKLAARSQQADQDVLTTVLQRAALTNG